MHVDFVTIETHKETAKELGEVKSELARQIASKFWAHEGLATANKAIVALSEALDFVTSAVPSPSAMDIHKANNALTTHADAIKRARGE